MIMGWSLVAFALVKLNPPSVVAFQLRKVRFKSPFIHFVSNAADTLIQKMSRSNYIQKKKKRKT